jgi:hypothetical protein
MLNSTTTCTTGIGTENCTTVYAESTSTDPSYFNGFTYGEIVISSLLFLNLALISVVAYQIIFRRIKIKNQ